MVVEEGSLEDAIVGYFLQLEQHVEGLAGKVGVTVVV